MVVVIGWMFVFVFVFLLLMVSIFGEKCENFMILEFLAVSGVILLMASVLLIMIGAFDRKTPECKDLELNKVWEEFSKPIMPMEIKIPIDENIIDDIKNKISEITKKPIEKIDSTDIEIYLASEKLFEICGIKKKSIS